MKRLITLIAIGFLFLIGNKIKAQNNNDTIVSAYPDTLYVGDTLHLTVFYQYYAANGEGEDSILFNDFGTYTYLHDATDVFAHSTHDTATFTNNIIIPSEYYFTDSTYYKFLLETEQSYNGDQYVNTVRKYIYIHTHKTAVGIESISGTNYHTIKEVRYYTITGQLYGTFRQKQTNLPNVPLIEEVVYTNNSYTTRELLHL